MTLKLKNNNFFKLTCTFHRDSLNLSFLNCLSAGIGNYNECFGRTIL